MVNANEIKNHSIDWRREAALAEHVLSNGSQTINPTRGLLEEELVFLFIYSEDKGDRRIDVL